ncbi:hypothetical protein EMCRGX_G004978 [Ephydatia muelleri]
MNRKELEKLACEVLCLHLGVAKLVTMENKAALVERLYLHLQDPSSKPEPEREDVPDTTPESKDSSESSSEGATTESTLYIFNQFASVLHWIMATADLIHYLDEFLLAGPPGQPTCSESTETMLRVCERLGIPVALDKLEGPVTTITFLGITIDTTLQKLRLPPDKLQEMTLLIKSWLRKHKTKKRDLRSLIGKREDIIWCNRFLPSQNGHPPSKTTPRHSTNSGTIRDGPEYEPPAACYPGVHISRVIPKTFVANLHTVYLFSQLFCSMKSPASTNQGVERSMPAAHLKPKRQPNTNEMLGQMLSQLDSWIALALKAAITLGFFHLLRVSEFTVPNQHGFNPDHMYMYPCSSNPGA